MVFHIWMMRALNFCRLYVLFVNNNNKAMNVPAIMEQWPFLFQAHCVVWSVVGHSYLIYWNIFDIFREYGRRQRTWETFLFQLKLRRHEIIWESLLLCTIWFARCLFSGMKLFERNFLMSWCYMRSRCTYKHMEKKTW